MPAATDLTRRRLLQAAAALPLVAAAEVRAQAPAPAAAPKRIVCVVSNEVVSPVAGVKVGYWLGELAHPYWAFQQKGWAVDVASPNGGGAVHDEWSDPEGGRFGNPADFLSIGFKRSPRIAAVMANTKPLAEVRVEHYDAILVIGGLAPTVTFYDNQTLHRLFAQFYERGRVAAAICHGSCILLKTRLADGRLLAEGKRWTGYCNLEEDAVDKAFGRRFQPFRIEDEAKKIPGTTFVQGPPFRPFAVTDGRLVTGQQSNSGAITAEHVIRALET